MPTASYALRSYLNIRVCLPVERRDRDYLSSVFYTPTDDTPSISTYQATVNPLVVGQGQCVLYDHVERNIWIYGVGGERLSAVSYAHSSNVIFCRLFSIHQRPNVFSQALGRRPQHITGRLVNTVSLGWVGTPNEHAPFRVHDAGNDFVFQCLTRYRIADHGVEVSYQLCGPCPCKICEDVRIDVYV